MKVMMMMLFNILHDITVYILYIVIACFAVASCILKLLKKTIVAPTK